MPLSVYVEKIRDGSLHYTEDGSDIAPMAKNIGFWCIAIDIGRIDTVTIDEWFARYQILRKLGVNFFIDGEGNDVEITYEDLQKHIGLTTNVSQRSRPTWLKHQIGGRMDDSIRDEKRRLAQLDAKKADRIRENLGMPPIVGVDDPNHPINDPI